MSVRSLVRRARANERGAVAIIVAIVATVLFGFAAMAVDLGNAWSRKRLTQTDADLAALAGAAQLNGKAASKPLAIQAAYDYLVKNLPGDDDTGHTPNDLLPFYTDGDLSNGEITVAANYMKITVVVQPRKVSFGLAGVVGYKSVGVQATAAAGLFSPADKIFPYLLPEGTPPGLACLKDTSNGQATSGGQQNSPLRAALLQTPPSDPPGNSGSNNNNGGSNNGGSNNGGSNNGGGNDGDTATCAGSIDGNFGYADIGREDTSETPDLRYNVRYGADHNPAVIDPLPTQSPQECFADGNPTGAILDDKNPPPVVDGFTCLGSETGQTMPDIVRGLVHFSGPNACDGRLADPSSSLEVDNCKIAEDKFVDYLPNGTDLDSFITAIPGAGLINTDIVSDPRFGFVPIIASPTLPTQGASNQYAIVDLYGVYYRDFYDQQGNLIGPNDKNAKIGAVDAYIFPLNFLPNEISYKGPVGSYIGVGPHVSRLVE